MQNTTLTAEAEERVAFPAGCSLLGMSRDRAMRLVNLGVLVGGQTLGRWWITRSSLDAYLAGRVDAQPAPAAGSTQAA